MWSKDTFNVTLLTLISETPVDGSTVRTLFYKDDAWTTLRDGTEILSLFIIMTKYYTDTFKLLNCVHFINLLMDRVTYGIISDNNN